MSSRYILNLKLISNFFPEVISNKCIFFFNFFNADRFNIISKNYGNYEINQDKLN